MLLMDTIEIYFRDYKLNHNNFPKCRNIINYLNNVGIYNSYVLNEHKYILSNGCFTDLEINLFLAYFVFKDLPNITKNQVFLSEMIIHLFFANGLDLMKESQVKYYYEIVTSYFPTCFPSYNRKILGSIIRKSKKLISYKQGGYVHIDDVRQMWNIDILNILISELKLRLKKCTEIDPFLFYEEYKEILLSSNINNSHYMFSVFKYLDLSNEIEYYRNTFNSKFRRKCHSIIPF